MANKTVQINDSAYTQLDTTSESAKDMQNVSDVVVRLIFAAAQPAVTATEFYILQPGQGFLRGTKTGEMWAMALSPSNVPVTVGE